MSTLTVRGLRPPLPDSGPPIRRQARKRFRHLWPGTLLRAAGVLGFFLISCPVSADPLARREQKWESRYESLTTGAEDVARTALVDGDGHVLVVGTTDDHRNGPVCLIQKLDGTTAQLLWERRLTTLGAVEIGDARLDQADALVLAGVGPARGAGSPYGTYFLAKVSTTDGTVLWQRDGPGANWRSDGRQASLAVDGEGDVMLAGATVPVSSAVDAPSYVGKYRGSDGSLVWEKVTAGVYEVPKALTCDSQGNVLMASSSLRVTEHGFDFVVAKFAAATGQVLWEARHNGPDNGPDEPVAMASDGANHVIVTGTSSGPTGSPRSFSTVKLDGASGALKWERRHRGPTGWDAPADLAVDAHDAIIVTGVSRGQFDNISDIYTAKYASGDGSVVWDRRFAATEFRGSQPVGVAVDPAGHVIVAGSSGGQTFSAKYEADSGQPIWEKLPEGGAVGLGSVSSLALDSTGASIVAGTAALRPDSHPNPDFLVIKQAAADGATLWLRRFDGPAQADETAVAAAIDAAGSVISTGFVDAPATGRDFLTRKLAAETGAEIWRRTHNGAANARDEAKAVAVDAVGAVVVAGITTVAVVDDEELGPVPGDPDFYTAKYAAADGAVLWERRYDGPAGGPDELVAMALDQAGNVLVTGYSTDTETKADFYTAKYAASDGALLWQQRHDGPASGEDRPVGLVVDAAGHVVVTGYTAASNGETNFFTIKYAGVDGSVLWTRAYDGGSNDRPTALAVDGQGNVGVAGFITTEASGVDMYTAKYAASTGALLWKQTYTSSGRHDERANALTMTAQGDVIVAGTSHPSGFAGPFSLMQMYGATTGDILWERRIFDDLPDPATTYAVVATSADHFLALGSQYFLNAPPSLVLTAHSLANGKPLDMDYVGTPSFEDWRDSAFGHQCIAVDQLGRVAVAAGAQNGDSGDRDALTVLLVPGRSPATLELLKYERFASGSWRLDGKTNPRDICVLEYSNTLSGWEFYGLMVADTHGATFCENWSNVPDSFLRLALPPWETLE